MSPHPNLTHVAIWVAAWTGASLFVGFCWVLWSALIGLWLGDPQPISPPREIHYPHRNGFSKRREFRVNGQDVRR